MILLDTDTLTLLFQGQAQVESRVRAAESDVAITIITWIEVMQGRFDALLKAADAGELERARSDWRARHDSLPRSPLCLSTPRRRSSSPPSCGTESSRRSVAAIC
jgi:predicted nucleic acid-binding protein